MATFGRPGFQWTTSRQRSFPPGFLDYHVCTLYSIRPKRHTQSPGWERKQQAQHAERRQTLEKCVDCRLRERVTILLVEAGFPSHSQGGSNGPTCAKSIAAILLKVERVGLRRDLRCSRRTPRLSLKANP